MITASEILSGGFRLLVGRPLAVLVWIVVHGVVAAAGLALVLPRMAAMMETMATLDPGASPQAAQAAMMQSMGPLQGLSWLLNFASLAVSAILLCAAYRAVLRPREGGFAFIRFGMDELRMAGMLLIVSFGGAIAAMIFFLIMLLLTFLIAFLLQNYTAVVVLICVVLWVAAIGAAIHVAVRLSMLFPLTFIRREFVFDEAWTLTRGRFWTLFLPYLAIALIVGLASSVVMFPLMWSMMSSLFANLPANGIHDPEQSRAVVAAFFRAIGSQTSTWILIALLGSVINGISLALNGGAMATAARGLLEETGKLPEELLAGDIESE